MPEIETRSRPLPRELRAALLDDGLPTEEKLALVETYRASRPRSAARLDRFFVDQVEGMRAAPGTARGFQERAEASMRRLTEPPLIAAHYDRPGSVRPGSVRPGHGEPVPTAIVASGTTVRMVAVAEDVDLATLHRGDEVMLNADQSLLVTSSPPGPGLGETAMVHRTLADGRLVVRVQDEQLLVEAAGPLRAESPQPGDLVRWSRSARLAFERLPRETNQEFMLDAIPDVPMSAVGGQADNLATLVDALTMTLVRPELAAAYGVAALPTLLMVGPPGTGKTLMARVAAAELQRLTGRRGHICVIKPGQFENMYVGETQRRIRECFAAMRAADGFGILFLDEVEAVARHRGEMVGQHSDRFLAALLAELQGFDDDPQRRFAVIACTNRLDLMDPALVERMEVQLFVKRPDLRAARGIFDIHLGADVPLDGVSRKTVIEHALSLLYGPNVDNDVCTVQLAGGEQRVVTTRDLMSGRCIQQICRSICRGAARRHVRADRGGVTLADVADAVADLREKLAATLTRRNVHCYLDDLPQDQTVTGVEPVRRVPRTHRALVA